MIAKIDVNLTYRLFGPTDILLQIEAAHLPDQQVVRGNLQTSYVTHFARVAGEAGIGERIWLRADGDFSCSYQAEVEIVRPVVDLSVIDMVSPHLLPGDTVHYLLPSRFCPSDQFQSFVLSEFGSLSGGTCIAAMRDWVHEKFQYVSGVSDAQTTALESFVQRRGVCRDFAHVLITLARAATIPARFASVYAPDVRPQDFHAVAEVYLDGGWYLVDPTGMAGADTIARIGVGADAAETAFLSSFGPAQLINQVVQVS
ncbi:MAG: transglutaminase family protein [Deltaproteobacteria bacterium]